MIPAPRPQDDVEALRAALAAEREARVAAEARATDAEAMIAHLKLVIAKLRHDRFGASSERGRKLLDQLELELGELVATAAEDAKAGTTEGAGAPRPDAPPRQKPVRGPLPAHLPRERVLIPSPSACPCCGGELSKLGEDITETLEVVPRSWKVVQTVRERHSCRSCERVTQPPAPFHPIARGRAGPNLLAMILEAKYGQHLPLNRQAETYAREGVELGVSTIADWVGTSAAALSPLHALIVAHVRAAQRLHGDDTTVPLLARGKTVTARLWTYVRDGRPFGGPEPPAAVFHFSRDRTAEHPNRHLAGYSGILQADAYAGFADLYAPGRGPGPITEAACWAHFRRKVFELAEVARAPLAAKAVRRIDGVFGAELEVTGRPAVERLVHREALVAPLVADLHAWMLDTRGRLSRHNDLAKALDYALKRWVAFTRFLGDGRICLTNNAAERAPRRGPRQAVVAVRRQRSRRRAGRDGLLPHRHREAERRGPARLARRRARPHRRPPGVAPRRAPAVELEARRGRPRASGLTMAAVSFVYTIARVAEMLGVDEERLDDLTLGLEPEDGRLSVYGPGEEATLAFTRAGVELLEQIIADAGR